MEIKFNVSKEERKALVKAVGELVGIAPVYLGAPGFKFAVGACVIDKDGVVVFDEGTSEEDVRFLLTELAARGFNHKGITDSVTPSDDGQIGAASDDRPDHSVIPDSGDGDPSDDAEHYGAEMDCDSHRLVINMPLTGYTASAIDNIEKLVTAKAWIIKKMAGAEELPIGRDEKYLTFPWFGKDVSPAEVDAYSRLVARLCETAKEKQRVTATERQLEDGDNEKFKARCFLLSLGFIGKEYAQARKILLAPMSGNGSHRAGDGKKAAPTGSETANSVEEPAEAVHVRGNDSGAEAPLRCGECDHHRYYTDGQLLTNVGEIVDTSGRVPDSYTHYCLNAPSGYRKLKHATDWSGFETAPKWCPLIAVAGVGVAGEEAAV